MGKGVTIISVKIAISNAVSVILFVFFTPAALLAPARYLLREFIK